LLIWVERLRMPRALVPAVRLLASASLFIYLTHWVVYPTWEASAPWFGTVSSLAIGVAAWYLYRLIGRALNHAASTGLRRRTPLQSEVKPVDINESSQPRMNRWAADGSGRFRSQDMRSHEPEAVPVGSSAERAGLPVILPETVAGEKRSC
jgi:hypothetical protein